MISTQMAETTQSYLVIPVKYMGGQRFENEIFSVRNRCATTIPSGTAIPVVMGFEWPSGGLLNDSFDIIVYNGRYYAIPEDGIRML